MDCPRCGDRLIVYRMGDAETAACESCVYVGIEVEHRSDRPIPETWEQALSRFRHRNGNGDDRGAAAFPAAVVEAALGQVEIPGSSETEPKRRAGIRRLYDRLVSLGRAQRADLLEAVQPEDVGYASSESFWRHAGRDGLAALPGVRPPDEGDRLWEYDPPRPAGVRG